MSDEAELQAKVAALAGQINRHKQQPHSSRPNNASYYQPSPPRWSPYGNVRGGRGAFYGTFRNRTLVAGGVQQPPAANNTDQPTTLEEATNNLIASRAGNKHQLMTKETYEREQRQQQAYQAQQAAQGQQTAPAPRILEFNGIKFQMKVDGSKLTRVLDADTDGKQTPKTVKVADVDFVRTKNGNLVRAMPLQLTARYLEVAPLSADGQYSLPRGNRPTSTKQCARFTKYGTAITQFYTPGHFPAATPWRCFHAPFGTCSWGPTCHDKHDPNQIAICKEYFSRGSCLNGENCDLSHDPTYNRVPACTYFLRGNCTNNACRYAHVDVSTSATLVCRPFATLGYCAKGTDCGHRHVFECPDYTNNGYCEAVGKKGCPLPHVTHARTLRKSDQFREKTDSDVSSDDEDGKAPDNNDDSDLDIVMDEDGYGLSQQRDYIAFE